MDWVKAVMIEREKTVSPDDLNLIKIVDTAEDVVEALDTFYKKYNLSPNF
jgi:predicted Rossmann-fold nucleotide-binding protein